MQDCVFIEGLQIDAIIGVLAHERVQRQPIELDLYLYFDYQNAIKTDQLDDTFCYDALCKQVTQFIVGTEFQLIERLAESVCEWLFEHYKIKTIRLTLRKPNAISQANTVGVTIERRHPELA